jgi:hypothetical protein
MPVDRLCPKVRSLAVLIFSATLSTSVHSAFKYIGANYLTQSAQRNAEIRRENVNEK